MPYVDEAARRLVRQHPVLVPVLQAMVDAAREDGANPASRLGEFSRGRVAAREPRTPRTLRVFLTWGLIEPSPRGTGSGRKFYVLTDRAAIERVVGFQDDAHRAEAQGN
jgi:hypothetical protein